MLTVLISRVALLLRGAARACSVGAWPAAAMGLVLASTASAADAAQASAHTRAAVKPPAAAPSKPRTVSDPATAQALRRLFDDEWERRMRHNPEEAAYFGDRRGAA